MKLVLNYNLNSMSKGEIEMKAITKGKTPKKLEKNKGVEIRVGEVVVRDHYDIDPCPFCGKVPTLLMNVMENKAVLDCDCLRTYSYWPIKSKEDLKAFVELRNFLMKGKK